MRKTRVKALLEQFIKERHRYPETTERVINEFRRYRKQKARKAMDMSRFHRVSGSPRNARPGYGISAYVKETERKKMTWMKRTAIPHTVKL